MVGWSKEYNAGVPVKVVIIKFSSSPLPGPRIMLDVNLAG